MPIGNLQSEGDLERFIEDRGAQQTQAFRSQMASLVQATTAAVLADGFTTGEATASGTMVALATDRPVVTVVQAGTYAVFFGAQFTAASAVTPAIGLLVNGSLALPEHPQTLSTGTGTAQIQGMVVVALAAGDVVAVRYRSQAAISVTFSNRRLALVRVSS